MTHAQHARDARSQLARTDEFRARRRSQRTMPQLRLRGPLKKLAGDRADHEVAGATVGEVLRALERENPAVAGWIVDERGRIRRHINVFVGGERADSETVVAAGDRVEVIPAISGGCT